MIPVSGTRAEGAPRREPRGGRGIPLSLRVQRGGLGLNLGKWEGESQGVSQLEKHIQRLERRREPGQVACTYGVWTTRWGGQRRGGRARLLEKQGSQLCRK